MLCPQISLGEGPGSKVTPHPFFCTDRFEPPSPARGEGTAVLTVRSV
jgi:hypothetical protein